MRIADCTVCGRHNYFGGDRLIRELDELPTLDFATNLSLNHTTDGSLIIRLRSSYGKAQDALS